MGQSHNHGKTSADTPLAKKHARALKIVFVLNAGMAVIEGVTGYIAHSKALLADTLDMAGDAIASGTSIIVEKKSPRTQAFVALAKAGVMMVMGLGVLAGAVAAVVNPVMPVMAVMGIVGGMALAANAASYALLYPYRNDNINIKSTMMCMRNDMVANIAVLGAAAVGSLILSPIPDIVVGVAISGLFLKSAVEIARESIAILRATKTPEEKKEAAPKKQKLSPENKFSLKKTLGGIFNRKATAKAEAPKQAPAVTATAPVPQP